jgi:uncharacterized membrane protein
MFLKNRDLAGNVQAETDGGFPSRMKTSTDLHFKTYLLIFLMVIFGPLGNVFLGKGMKELGPSSTGSITGVVGFVFHVISSGTIWLGIASLLTFFVAYTLVLSWADYSYVQPASAAAYGMVALLGHFVLREVVSPLRWIGVILICCGVLVVGNTPPSTTIEGK